MDFTAEVIGKEQLTHDVIKLSIKVPQDFEYQPGQFITFMIEMDGEVKPRSYSILSSESGRVDFAIKLIPDGFAGEVFRRVEVGDKFNVKGPLGHFTLNENSREHWLIGCGCGLAPLYCMLNVYLEKFPEHKFYLLFSVKFEKDLILHEELKELGRKYENFTYIPTLTREEWSGKMGRVQKHLPENVQDKTFYICGLKELVVDTKDLLLEKGVPKENIKFERYS